MLLSERTEEHVKTKHLHIRLSLSQVQMLHAQHRALLMQEPTLGIDGWTASDTARYILALGNEVIAKKLRAAKNGDLEAKAELQAARDLIGVGIVSEEYYPSEVTKNVSKVCERALAGEVHERLAPFLDEIKGLIKEAGKVISEG